MPDHFFLDLNKKYRSTGILHENTEGLLLNTLFLKGFWLLKMERMTTESAPFFLDGEHHIATTMMHANIKCGNRYFPDLLARTIFIPFVVRETFFEDFIESSSFNLGPPLRFTRYSA